MVSKDVREFVNNMGRDFNVLGISNIKEKDRIYRTRIIDTILWASLANEFFLTSEKTNLIPVRLHRAIQPQSNADETG